MPLKLPDFKSSHCVSVTVCGEIKSADRATAKWLRREKTRIGIANTGAGKAYLRVAFGGYSGRHLHVDVTKASLFKKPFRPSELSSAEAIQKKLDRLIGEDVKSDLIGRFDIRLNELPDGGIIRSLFFETQTGDVAIKVNGASLSITGAPINSIRWKRLSNETIGVTLETENVETAISESYLTSALDRLEAALNVFVLGTSPK